MIVNVLLKNMKGWHFPKIHWHEFGTGFYNLINIILARTQPPFPWPQKTTEVITTMTQQLCTHTSESGWIIRGVFWGKNPLLLDGSKMKEATNQATINGNQKDLIAVVSLVAANVARDVLETNLQACFHYQNPSLTTLQTCPFFQKCYQLWQHWHRMGPEINEKKGKPLRQWLLLGSDPRSFLRWIADMFVFKCT